MHGSRIAKPTAATARDNLLLRALAPDDRAALAPVLVRVPLDRDAVLARAGTPIDTLWFPEGGVVGFADVLDGDRRLAVAITGRDGFAGWPIVLGNDRWPHEVIVRAEAATALRVRAHDLLAAMADRPGIRDVLARFAGTLVTQMARTIASNLIHPIEARAARWLLLYHDRVDGDEIRLTHEEVGIMLGCRRSSITEALARLEDSGALRGLRGRVVVRDRRVLEAMAGDTYGFAEAEYARLIAR